VKLGIKEKRQEKRQEEGCMEWKVHIGNKWWKIMITYNKEMKTTRRRVEDAMKENMEDYILLEWIEENGWEVLNGNKQGDEKRNGPI
jgi:peptide subunit release factor 1 (eRF1)